jgi:2-oxoglutarate dehydrogenase E1 component
MENNATYMPLQHLTASQARVEIVNSPLSEAAILGFEYGYSLDCPHGLVAWEAQFGDFWNVAQVIVDQFISSAEDKWGRLSRLIMLLPHGFEGAGPEHCSARLERLLQLCAEDNMIVAQPTTPAQYFHLLRRQVKRRWSKPLVVMTPKWLLRHPMVLSAKEEFTAGRFVKILKDERTSPAEPKRVLLCTGKVYYELVERRQNTKADHVAILRVEQLYPLSNAEVMGALEPYRAGTEVVWVQDEPANMGAWTHIKMRFGDAIQKKFPLSVVSRTESASPATGSPNTHKLEQQELLDAAFANL